MRMKGENRMHASPDEYVKLRRTARHLAGAKFFGR